jgi:hypothetical protein
MTDIMRRMDERTQSLLHEVMSKTNFSIDEAHQLINSMVEGGRRDASELLRLGMAEATSKRKLAEIALKVKSVAPNERKVAGGSAVQNNPSSGEAQRRGPEAGEMLSRGRSPKVGRDGKKP